MEEVLCVCCKDRKGVAESCWRCRPTSVLLVMDDWGHGGLAIVLSIFGQRLDVDPRLSLLTLGDDSSVIGTLVLALT